MTARGPHESAGVDETGPDAAGRDAPDARWVEVSLVADQALAERIGDFLAEAGAASVTMTDAGDEPLLEPWPGTAPLWSAVRVTALMEPARVHEGLRAGLEAAIAPHGCPPWTVEALADRDWVRESQSRFGPMRFGRRLCVCPSWCDPPAEASVVVALDPGVAFGTGTHQSTALCLDWLDGEPLDDARVIDYGCGSGLLAIAALALGARSAAGVDIDPQACESMRENAGRNGFADRVSVHAPGELLEPADVVVANILAGPLVSLAGTLTDLVRPGGRLALAGITEGQVSEVAAAYDGRFRLEPPVLRDAWALLVGTRI